MKLPELAKPVRSVGIVGVLLTDRVKEAKKIQEVLTDFGCTIRTRLGLHEAATNVCGKNGLIILELIGDKAEWDKLESQLKAIEGVEVKNMEFNA